MVINHASPFTLILPFFFTTNSSGFFFHQSWPLPPTMQKMHRSPDTRSPFMSLDLIRASPFPWNAPTLPSPQLPATCYSFSSVSTVSLSVPSLTQWSFPGVSLNLALTSFKGMIRRHCNWLFSCLPLLRLWALRWQRAFGNACGLNSTWLEWGFNDWFLNMWFTHWGHWGKSEEKSHPPNSSTTELWDFYKLFSFHVAVFSFIK